MVELGLKAVSYVLFKSFSPNCIVSGFGFENIESMWWAVFQDERKYNKNWMTVKDGLSRLWD